MEKKEINLFFPGLKEVKIRDRIIKHFIECILSANCGCLVEDRIYGIAIFVICEEFKVSYCLLINIEYHISIFRPCLSVRIYLVKTTICVSIKIFTNTYN